MMNPLYQHDCLKGCEFIGTVFGVYDIYIHKNNDNDFSCIARYGDEGSEYASMPLDINKEIKEVQSKIGGVSRSHAIVLIMFRYMPSLVMNHMKTADEYNKRKAIIDRTYYEFRAIEANPDIVDRIVKDLSDCNNVYLKEIVTDMKITNDLILDHINKYDIDKIPHAECSICHKMTFFEVVRGSDDVYIYFNGSCKCVDLGQKRPSSIDALRDHIVNNSNWKLKMASMICCGIIPFTIP